MSASRDEYTRVVFTRGEAIPRPVAAIEILRDYDETVRRGRYYGPVDVITTAAEFLYHTGVALQGVTHLTPSQVGVDMATSINQGLSVFVVWPQSRLGEAIHVIEQVLSSDIRRPSGERGTLAVSKRVVGWLELGRYVMSVFDGMHYGLADREFWPSGPTPLDHIEVTDDDKAQ